MSFPARWTRWPAKRTRQRGAACFVVASALGVLALFLWPVLFGTSSAIAAVAGAMLSHLAGSERMLAAEEIRDIALAARTQPISAEVLYWNSDQESERFARQIKDALERGRWDVMLVDALDPDRFTFWVDWEDESVEEVAGTLVGALRKIGLPAAARRHLSCVTRLTISVPPK